jgi:hypothetical protein
MSPRPTLAHALERVGAFGPRFPGGAPPTGIGAAWGESAASWALVVVFAAAQLEEFGAFPMEPFTESLGGPEGSAVADPHGGTLRS